MVWPVLPKLSTNCALKVTPSFWLGRILRRAPLRSILGTYVCFLLVHFDDFVAHNLFSLAYVLITLLPNLFLSYKTSLITFIYLFFTFPDLPRLSFIVSHPIFSPSHLLFDSSLSDIIGKGGANIRSIQDFTGVKLSIPQVS